MKGKERHKKAGATVGLSILEVLVTVFVVGVLATITVVGLGNIHKSAGEVKLESDVKTLNRAVASYIGANGKVSDFSDAEEVLTRLKTAADAASSERLLGLTGSAIDPRIRPAYYEEGEIRDGMLRISWNASKAKFEITDNGPGRIKGFVSDVSAIPEEMATSERAGMFALAEKDEWIWDYVEVELDAPPVPGPEIPTYDITDAVSPPPTVGPPTKSLSPLVPPVFSIPSTTRPIIEFELGLALSNPNPAGSSSVYFSKDYGPWAAYNGNVIAVAPDTVIQAQSISNDRTRYSNSGLAQEQYKASPLQLEPPLVSSSLDRFSPIDDEVSEIEILNPNDASYSNIEYQVNGGGWSAYVAPFDVTMASYPAGAHIEAKVVGISKYYLESDISTAAIGSSPRDLDPPLINFSHDAFSTDKKSPVSQINVVLQNPNPSDISLVNYRIVPIPGKSGNETDFQPYSGPFVVPRFLYPDGFGIVAYAKGTSPDIHDSKENSRYASTRHGVFGGHLDLDTSDFLAKVGDGSTSAHTHDITGKYDLTEIDFFGIPDSKQLEINEAITQKSQGFKLTIVNADLSPGMRLMVSSVTNGVETTQTITVAEYDDTPVESLPVFSLGGNHGTAQLTGLELQFDKDVIREAAIVPTNTGDVKSNVPGKNGEWRNGSLTLQAVEVHANGRDDFSTDSGMSAGGHGAATSGLLWEAALFWHWEGDSYHESKNGYVPGEASTVSNHLEDDD